MGQALEAGTPIRRRRAFFGALDADGWAWASLKAFGWFIAILIVIGYIPDRAYYLTVNRTLEIGLPLWTPVNFCPAENRTLPCPAPGGAFLPWDPSPAELALPGARTGGATGQLGTNVLFVGGSDGTAATTTTYRTTVKAGNFAAWTAGPALPAARADAGAAVIGNTLYLLGGTGPDGKPTDTVWSLALDQATGQLGAWTPVEGLALPAARSGAAVLAVSDGILVAGGDDVDGKPTADVWKSTLKSGKLGAFEAQQPLLDPISHGAVTQVGDYVWLYGGTDANGPSGAVQRGAIGTGGVVASPGPNPIAPPLKLLQWGLQNAANLPVARTGAAGFAANGALYVVGGADAAGPRSEIYWTVPDATGNLPGWSHLDAMDLPRGGLVGASAVVAGSSVFVVGGTTSSGILASSARASLAPQEPFFRLGLVGAVVPALRIEGEIGQQLGYLSAFTVGMVNFAILVLIGWAFAHKAQVSDWWARRRSRRAG